MIHEISDYKNSLANIDYKIDEIKRMLVKLGIEFTNKIGGLHSQSSKMFFDSRDSLGHRLDSIRYHINIIRMSEKNIPDMLDDFLLNGYNNTTATFALDLSQQLAFLFEDLIFNIISLLDYLANLISLVFNQEMIDDWSRIVKASRAKSQNPISISNVAEPILLLDQEITNKKLDEYRNEVIHKRAHLVRIKTTVNFTLCNHTVHVFAPFGFLKKFKELKHGLRNGDDFTLIYVSFWVFEKCITRLQEILIALSKDIEESRKILHTQEAITLLSS